MECLPLYSSFENVEICEHSQLFPLQCWQGLPPSYNAELYLTVVILVPHLILVYCNIRVFQATRSMRKVSVFLSAPSRYSKGIQQCREHRITVVTFMVTITFFVCWMPYCISTICLASGKSDLPKEFTSVALMMAIANSCCNPIIYGIMNRSFRKAFREILCCITYKDN